MLIGQNDTKNEYFTLDNARDINTFALETSLGHLSMWSLNRDQQCGENYTNTNTLKTFCSGMKQTGGEFATTLRIRIPRHTGHARRFRQRKLEFLAAGLPHMEARRTVQARRQGDLERQYLRIAGQQRKQAARQRRGRRQRTVARRRTGAINACCSEAQPQTQYKAVTQGSRYFPSKVTRNKGTKKQSWHRSNRNIRQPPAVSQKTASESRSDSPFWPSSMRCALRPRSPCMRKRVYSGSWKTPHTSAYGRPAFCCA